MWFRKRPDADFQAELESHLRLEVDRLIEEGMTPAEAEAAARRTFGNVTTAQERFYESQRWVWFDQLRQDLRFGTRSLSKTPGFTAAAALTIALGVGATTAIFSLMEAVLLRSLPVENPQKLVFLEAAGSAGRSGPPPYPYLTRMRAETRSFAGLAAFATDECRVVIDGKTEQVRGQIASGNYFEVLGVRPLLGRLMRSGDERLDPPVAVIGEQYWRRRFGADPAVLGKTITVGKRQYQITGVTPARFTGLQPGWQVEITLPITIEQQLLRNSDTWWLHGIVGRLGQGVSSAQARAEADSVFQSFMADVRMSADLRARIFHHIEAVTAAQGMDTMRSKFSQPIYALMGTALLLLSLATVNIANLLLSRGLSRSREFAIRLAAGAGAGRIVRQLITETVLLFCAGAIPGVLSASWGVSWIEEMFLEGRRGLAVEASINWGVLAFTVSVTLICALTSCLFPAWRASRTDPEQTLTDGHARSSESRGAGILAQSMVAFQVGLSFVLLVGALLFATTLYRLRNVDMGFHNPQALTMSVLLPDGYSDQAKAMAAWSRVLDEVRMIPDVELAALSNFTPLSGRDRGAMVQIRGYQPATSEDATVHTNQVSQGYFESMGISLVRGRLITDRDTGAAPRIAVVNQAAVRKFFSDRDPIGESIEFRRRDGTVSYQIVGVVRDTKHMNLREVPKRFVFLPMLQPRVPEQSEHRMTLVLSARAAGTEARLLPAVRSAVARVDPGLFISDITTVKTQVEVTLLTERLLSGLSMAFGFLALVLAATGLHGVLSYRVGQQRHSIGIRMALGASASRVKWTVLRRSGAVVILGLLCGLPLAYVAARMAESLLYGVNANEPFAYATGAAVLGIASLLSSYVPARRAAAVEPVEILRQG